MFSISKRPTIGEIHDLYKTGKATPSQVIQFFLNRSKQIDKKINAIVGYTEELATQEADELDKILDEYRNSNDKNWFDNLTTKYPLFGIIYTVKAIILVENEVFTSASKILDNFKAPYSSTVYLKTKAAGAICMAVSNMDQFAMGSSGENSDYGVTRNPFDTDRIPGGSSSGPVVAVASGQVIFSLGTDTGGSIRQPAGFCDVVGLKPTYGLVSRYGVMPMASSLDQVGPITNNVEDNLIVTKVLAGKDKKDQTSQDSKHLINKLEDILTHRKNTRPTKQITKTTYPLKIGLPKEFYTDGIDPTIQKAIGDLQAKLSTLGHTLVEVDLPLIKYAISVYYMTMSVEVAANLERIDGIRYANQQENYSSLFFEHRGKYFGDEPKRRIMLGTYASASGYYDAYYNHAQKVRELARRDFDRIFEEVDLLLTPTSPEFPFKIGEKTDNPLKMYLSDVFTCGINPVRIPGLNVPLGLFKVNIPEVVEIKVLEETKVNATTQTIEQEDLLEVDLLGAEKLLPAGCQILGPEFSEDIIYKLAEEIEILVRNS